MAEACEHRYRTGPKRPLVDELTDMLLSASGRSFVSPPAPRNQSWDRIVDDLLRVTAKRVFGSPLGCRHRPA